MSGGQFAPIDFSLLKQPYPTTPAPEWPSQKPMSTHQMTQHHMMQHSNSHNPNSPHPNSQQQMTQHHTMQHSNLNPNSQQPMPQHTNNQYPNSSGVIPPPYIPPQPYIPPHPTPQPYQSEEPEAYASLTDVIQASKLVEDAIHQPTGPLTAASLREADNWLQYAIGYFNTGINSSSFLRPQYILLRNQTVNLQSQLRQLADSAKGKSGSDLKAFQQGPLYAFMGPMGKLYYQLSELVRRQYS